MQKKDVIGVQEPETVLIAAVKENIASTKKKYPAMASDLTLNVALN